MISQVSESQEDVSLLDIKIFFFFFSEHWFVK